MRARFWIHAVCLTTAVAVVAPMAEAGAAPSNDRQHRLAASVERLAAPEYAAAATIRKGGFAVSVPSSVTTFNRRKVRIAPTVRVGAVKRQVTSRRITVYSGSKRVASGKTVRLPIGRYKQSVTVGFRSYKIVTRHRVVTERRYIDGGYPSGTSCTITAVSSSGASSNNDHIDSASCTNAGYPQTVTATGSQLSDVPQDSGTENYTPGQAVTTGAVYFDGYTKTVKRTVAYRVKVLGARGRVVTRRTSLVVKDGGYLKIWTGADTTTRTIRFTTTKKSRWIYVLSCGEYAFFGVVWQTGDDHGSFGPQENTPYGDSAHAYNSRFVGRTKFQVFANDCYWGLGVASKGKIR